MTTLLGLDSITIDNYDNFSTPDRAIIDNFVGLADGTATEAVLWTDVAGIEVKILIYDASRNLISSTQFTTVVGENVVTLSTPVAITNGVTYHLGTISGDYWQIGRDSTISRTWMEDNSGTFAAPPNPHSTTTTNNERTPLFYLRDSGGPIPSIESVGGDNSLQVGETGAITRLLNGDPASTVQSIDIGGVAMPINSWVTE